MNIHSATALPATCARLLSRGIAVLLCTLALNVAHAANTSLISSPPAKSSAITLKQRLAYLRDLTAYSLAPVGSPLSNGYRAKLNTSSQLENEDLFKPLKKFTQAERIKQLMKQQMDFEIGPNTLFQCEFKRLQITDENREVGVRLGIHVDFR
ncbi:MAG: hypothetical protein QM808_03050 [Steroidobacteraceae bacterium]